MKLPLAIAASIATLALTATSAFAGPDELVAKDGCHKCHKAKTTAMAPSWGDLAAKYKGDAKAADKLFDELKKGGKVGDSDDHKKVTGSDADIKAIVQMVLTAK
jgi:cytochrome c